MRCIPTLNNPLSSLPSHQISQLCNCYTSRTHKHISLFTTPGKKYRIIPFIKIHLLYFKECKYYDKKKIQKRFFAIQCKFHFYNNFNLPDPYLLILFKMTMKKIPFIQKCVTIKQISSQKDFYL